MDDKERLVQLLRAKYPCVLIPTFEERHAMEMMRQVALDAGTNLRVWSYSRGVHDGLIEGSRTVGDTEPPAAGLYYMLSNRVSCINVVVDLVEHLSDARVLRVFRDLVESQRAMRGQVVMVDYNDKLPDVIADQCARFDLSLPDENELTELIKSTVRREHAEQSVSARVSASALKSIVRNLRGLTRRQAEQIIVHVISEDRRFTDQDINGIMARKRQLLHKDGLLEYVESLTGLDQIAGLNRLKEWLKKREFAMSDARNDYGLPPPRGILMLGVPGAGKSLCAKAVAAAWHRPLLRLDPSVLYDRYIGESERRLREALHQAEAMSPNVLWVDEIEKGFSSAASRNIDGGLSQRMFGTLLTWMQEHRSPVFMIATANNIDAIPAELLRKGRFDEIFFVDLPTPEGRRAIFAIHLAKRKLDPAAFDLDALTAASEGYTGAEIEQAIVSSLHDAVSKKAPLDTAGVLESLHVSPPLSVTMREYIGGLRDWATGRCVPAD